MQPKSVQAEAPGAAERAAYERAWARFAAASAGGRQARYADVPWPSPHASTERTLAVLLHGAQVGCYT